jgi:hypothetical protein
MTMRFDDPALGVAALILALGFLVFAIRAASRICRSCQTPKRH